ncbi:hypothetical protein O181_033879 [Austropuccinia psidii MF-1]|uniref:Uncharacterized protein n=1 Tax=Austropuccinia psidii MF-1 TaxID=1389203 RepID=A0A9Q3CZX2_9BASI|nr:hypothetical protein [Austropuccinia psidii MF-1]
MNSYLCIKSFLGQEKTIELPGRWSPLSFKEKVKKINNWLKKQDLLSIDQKKELEITPALEKEGPETSKKIKKDFKRKIGVPRTIKASDKEKPIGTEITHKGKCFPNRSLQLSTVCSIRSEPLCNSQPRSRKGLKVLFHANDA